MMDNAPTTTPAATPPTTSGTTSTSSPVRIASPIDIVYALILLSLGPMVWLQANSLWNRPHLQFFPLAWLAFGYFLFDRSKGVLGIANSQRQVAAIGVMLVSLVAAVEAVLISSPWLSYVAGVLVIVSWMLLRVTRLGWHQVLGISSLLWITVPLPAGYDNKLIQYLQAQSSYTASMVLDAIGILHVREGNILQLMEKRLFVDEACSGVDSLYALMAISLTLVLWMRQPLSVAIGALCMVPVWASCSNILRLVTIVLSLEWLGLDLSSGTPHTILGLVVFVIAFACDFAFIQFLGAVVELPHQTKKANLLKDRPGRSFGFTRSERHLQRGPELALPVASSNSSTALRWAWILSGALALCFLGVGAYSTRVLSGGTIFRFPEFTEASLAKLKESLQLPNDLNDWKLFRTELVERSKENSMGQFSHVWLYNSTSTTGTLSVDFPFRGFHLLDICYEGAGWRQQETQPVIESPLNDPQFASKGDCQVHFLDLIKDTGEYAYVAYVQFQLDGTPVKSAAVSRGFERFEQTFLEPVTYQIQSIALSNQPIPASAREATLKNLLAAATKVRPTFVGIETKD
ncbi:exosortase U [Pirellula sp. SH-Sr6A]|uniref:exosortase U n=1 Tax=Pirellula sp. SH-Sr6A TaxID=1632865 RepID=UPI00143C933F|nr:exosortase U [Pirellula sp. SH-Sr6A]